MNTLYCAWLLAAKDLRCYFRDRAAFASGFLLPIALVTVFGWIMTAISGGSSGMPKATLYVVDEENSEASKRLVAQLRKADMLKIEPKLDAPAATRAELQQKVVDGDVSHVLVIPQGFKLDSAQENSPELVLIRDPGRKMEQQIIQIGVMQSVMAVSGGNMWWGGLKKMFKESGMTDEQLKDIEVPAESMTALIGQFLDENESSKNSEKQEGNASTSEKSEVASVEEKKQEDKQEEETVDPMSFMTNMVAMENIDIEPPARPKRVTYQAAQSISGVSVMMLLFALTGCGSVLLAEREQGTLRRLFAMAIPRNSVLLGKFFFSATVGLIQMAVLMVYSEFMFRVGLFRDPVTLAILVVSWVATACSFGMLIAASSSSSKQGDSLSTVIILVMAALGGCWFPLQLMSLPTVLDFVSKSMMTYWAMSGFQGMLWNQLDLTSSKMWIALAWQWGWAISLGALAMYFFRRNYCRG